jgi:hypothetical protein
VAQPPQRELQHELHGAHVERRVDEHRRMARERDGRHALLA